MGYINLSVFSVLDGVRDFLENCYRSFRDRHRNRNILHRFVKFQPYEYVSAFVCVASVQKQVRVAVVAYQHLGFCVTAFTVVRSYFSIQKVAVNKVNAPRFWLG